MMTIIHIAGVLLLLLSAYTGFFAISPLQLASIGILSSSLPVLFIFLYRIAVHKWSTGTLLASTQAKSHIFVAQFFPDSETQVVIVGLML